MKRSKVVQYSSVGCLSPLSLELNTPKQRPGPQKNPNNSSFPLSFSSCRHCAGIYMPENSKVWDASTFRSLTAFKPRQVLLLSSKQRLAMKHDSGKTLSMSKDQKALLLQSICLYLEKNGFSKTLNKFRSEAEMEKDSWKSCSLILEEIFIKHLQTNHANVDNNTFKGQFGLGDVTVHKVDKKSKDLAVDVEVKVEGKKREKIADSVPNHVTPSKTSSEGALSLMSKPTKKSKEKKKNDKLTKKSLNEESESHQKSIEIMGGMPMDGSSVKSKSTNDSENMEKNKSEEKAKSKSKKKKQESVTPDGLCVGTEEITTLENRNEKEKERKSSKKRKNNSSEDNMPSHDEGKENSKRRKTNNSDEQVTEVMTSYANGNIAQEENVDQQTPSSKTPVNGVMAKKEEDKSSTQRSTKKKQNNSAEPKALNAFQRVKADEIEFADERLQDNSYWAKDGADSGYGAKAQEVLGQVRGRGFRHEKTKKKRGSYRGGQIDLQSHSVKFVYEEEDA